MKILFLVSFLFLSIFRLQDYKVHTNNSYCFKSTDTSKYAILKPNAIPQYIFDKSSNSVDLSTEDINKIDELLNNLVEKQSGAFHINPTKYYKQLIAVTNSKGEKAVWVNCLCSLQNHFYWKKSIVMVLDGGPCYFNLKINLTKNTLYDLIINGVG